MDYDEESYAAARRGMVEELKAEGYLHDPDVERALLAVPRHKFLPRYIRQYAYNDSPLAVMRGQTISAPHMVSLMCELIKPAQAKKVLEVGSGTGYHACVCAEAMGGGGVVFSVEVDPYLSLYAAINVVNNGYSRSVKVYRGNGREGLPRHSPFDAVLVTAAADSVPPALLNQLREGGVMVIPLREGDEQVLYRIFKLGGETRMEPVTPVLFVPLK
ncbi:protein-L-isoaspartate O-methyltransferase [Thermocladium modestius]|uniref:Protein-L-isoaspartate O-methyltransferase n=1 Tax=Thermocladium modestius TaxID=62609 RepID=A0A830GUL8_9CREN|nr:protein-L-isoaspartate O-methyltransferase [Thermocladium modestius]GGP21428.1 protein-L-isoaspartate O-methyltransferase [Thermocladium modestius]